jgi:uncharacterized protein YegL
MPETIPEAIVIILDASRSMFKSDLDPNRLKASITGICNFIQLRENQGGNCAYALIVVKSTAKKMFDFADGAKYDQFQETLSQITCSGRSALGEGVALAIKLIIEDLRTNGARVPRILVFSDGKYTPSKVALMKMAALSQQLGIQINPFHVGDADPFNVMNKLATQTGGNYFYVNSGQAILNATQQIAKENVFLHGMGYKHPKENVDRKVLKKIAAPLLTEGEMGKGTTDQQSLISRLRGTKSYEKCSICFQANDPISKTPFSIAGRYCPNCSIPMHTSCASMWAKNQDKEGDGTVFRCVHCLYLLKIPASVQTAVKMHQNVQKDIRQRQKRGIQQRTFPIFQKVARLFGDQALYAACPICDGIFEEDETVIKCGNPDCQAIYHEHCFKKLPNSVCKQCNAKMVENV